MIWLKTSGNLDVSFGIFHCPRTEGTAENESGVSVGPERLRGGEQRRRPRVAQRRPGSRARGEVSRGDERRAPRRPPPPPSTQAQRPGPRGRPRGLRALVPEACPRSRAAPAAPGKAGPGSLSQLRVAGEVLWGNRTGSIPP